MTTQNIPVSQFPVAISLDGTELVPIVQGGATKRTTTGAIGNTATGFVPTSRRVNTGDGLTGGGALTTDLTLQLSIVDLPLSTAMVAADQFAINSSASNTPQRVTFPNALKAIAGLTHKTTPAGVDRMPFYSIADSDSRYSTVNELFAAAGSLPTGGTTGQPLVKIDGTDFNTQFATLQVLGGGTGAITFTNHGVLLGQGTGSIVATAVMTNGQLLIGQTGADPAPTTVTGDITLSNLGVTAVGSNKITNAMLRQSAGLSVIGRSASTIGNVADIVGAANQVLVVDAAGATLGFGSLDISQTATVGSTILRTVNGGTGLSAYVLGDTIYASAANTLARLAGNITTGIQYLSQTGSGAVSAAPVWATISGTDITGAALTKTDDTNVTLTLGGTPATALLRAASLTLGWTGQLSLTRGGTNASLIASNGGIFYSTATAGAILAGTATARQMLQSGATAAPAWSTATWPATTTINQILYSNAANTVTGLATVNGGILNASSAGVPSLTVTPVLGVAGSATGTLGLSGITSGLVTITPQAAAGTATFTLPNTSGTPAISVPSPLSLSATTGAVTWSGLTSGGVLYASGTTSVASSALLAANAIVLGGGAGVAPATLGSLGTTTTVLHGNAAGAPTFGAVSLTTDVTGILTVPNGGTGVASATAYAVLCGGTTSTAVFQSVASVGSGGQVLTSNGPGVLPTFQTVTGTGTVTSVTPGNGLTTTLTATAPGSAITNTGTLSSAQLVNAQTGASYAIVDGDRAKLVTTSNAGAQAYTIAQAGAASAFQSGWYVDVSNISTAAAGVVTITPSTSTINGSATFVLNPGVSARIVSDGTNYQVALVGQRARAVGQCYLSYSAGSLVLSPLDGNNLTINSVVQTIPDAGVSLAGTSTVSGTFYYIYAFMSSGTMTMEFSATAYATQAGTGLKIKSGDATRTLVGIWYASGTNTWSSNNTDGASWFNPKNKSLVAGPNNPTVSATSVAFVPSAVAASFVTFTLREVMVEMRGSASATVATASILLNLGLDASTTGQLIADIDAQPASSSEHKNFAENVTKAYTEGRHTLTPTGFTSTGTVPIVNLATQITIWG